MNLLQQMKAAKETEQPQAGQAQALALAACSLPVSSAVHGQWAQNMEALAKVYDYDRECYKNVRNFARAERADEVARTIRHAVERLRTYAESANERQPEENTRDEPRPAQEN